MRRLGTGPAATPGPSCCWRTGPADTGDMPEQQTTDLTTYDIGRISHSPIRVDELRPAPSDDHFLVRLTETLVVMIRDDRGEITEAHFIDEGFIFDGASVRYRWANGVMLRWGRRSTPAAAVHDWYYSDGRHEIPSRIPEDQRRKWCDDLFLKILLAAGVNPVRARLAYRAVRLFGGKVWSAGTEIGYDKPQIRKQNSGNYPPEVFDG